METYFDASVGSGTYAPRKRAPYASKRLQKVVTDFRKKQKLRASASEVEEHDSSDGNSSPNVEPPSKAVAQKSRKRKATSKEALETKKRSNQASDSYLRVSSSSPASVDVSKSVARKQKPIAKKRRTARSISTSDDDDGAESGQDESGVVPDRPLAVKLRPRPNPRYQPKGADEMEDGDSDGDIDA